MNADQARLDDQIRFATAFATGLVKIRDAAAAETGCSLEPDETAAVLRAVRLGFQTPEQLL